MAHVGHRRGLSRSGPSQAATVRGVSVSPSVIAPPSRQPGCERGRRSASRSPSRVLNSDHAPTHRRSVTRIRRRPRGSTCAARGIATAGDGARRPRAGDDFEDAGAQAGGLGRHELAPPAVHIGRQPLQPGTVSDHQVSARLPLTLRLDRERSHPPPPPLRWVHPRAPALAARSAHAGDRPLRTRRGRGRGALGRARRRVPRASRTIRAQSAGSAGGRGDRSRSSKMRSLSVVDTSRSL